MARVWIVSLTIGAGLLVSTAAGVADQAKQKGGTLQISRGRDIDSVDPALAYLPDSWMLEFATCAKLYNFPDRPAPEGAVPVPEVATDFPTLSPDGKTQTIRLRRTFRFSTGRPVTAANFVAAFNRDASPKLQSPATAYLHEIAGADAVIQGKAQSISGLRALGPYTLQIRTTRRLADLPVRLSMPFFCPIGVDTPAEEIDDPPGSGPYYVASRVPNRQVVLERNRFYRGSRPANVDRIVMTVAGSAACHEAVEHDQLDYCAGAGVPQGEYRELVASYGLNRKDGRFFFNPTLGMSYFVFNHDRPAFKGPGQIPLKQAINWAIDRPALVRAAGYLAGKRVDHILPPALNRSPSIYPLGGVSVQSLRQARALLAKARVRPSKLVLYASNAGSDPAMAQVFRFNLRRIGIDVDVKYFPISSFYGVVGTRGEPFDVALFGWIPDYADGFAVFGPLLDGNHLTPTDNNNIAYFDQPKYNRAIERIGSLAGESRGQAWADLDAEMMRDDPPMAPVMAAARTDYVSQSYGCFVFQPVIGRPDLVAACKT
ncbi:MAG: ABC transporter substrate-binding protein [Verrucomicrobiota bacterium]